MDYTLSISHNLLYWIKRLMFELAFSDFKKIHGHWLFPSMQQRNSSGKFCLTDRSTIRNYLSQVSLCGEQCRILRKILCAVLKGVFKDREIPLIMHVCTPLHVLSHNTVASSFTDVEANNSFLLQISLRFSECFYLDFRWTFDYSHLIWVNV